MKSTSKTTNAPKLRFPEFTDDWECWKLGEIAEIKMCKRIFKEQTTEIGEVPFFKIGTFGSKPDAYISYKLFDEYRKKYPFPNIGDILISASGSIGRTVEYQGEEAYYQDSNIVWIDHKNKLNNLFLKQFYNIVRWKGIEGSTIQRLYNKTILETEINFPTLAEQTTIGNFFRQLDKLIALHQGQLDKVKTLKKGLLQKMFPAQGETVPQIRFPQFTGDWEIRKLGEIAKTYSGGTPSISHKSYYNGNIPFIRSGEIYSDSTELFLSEEGLKKSSAKLVNKGDIIYALYGATSGEVSRSLINGAINQAILAIIPKENYENEFICQFLKKQKDKIISTYLQGGQGNLSGEIVKNLTINTPKSKSEQTTIGNFFRQFDDLISLHQRKLEHLKMLKKSLLQQMFV